MPDPQPPQDLPTEGDPRLEALARLEEAFAATLTEAAEVFRQHGLDPYKPESREAIQHLATAFDLVLRTGAEAWGLPSRGQMVVVSEDIALEDLRDLAGDGTDDEPISLPPAVLSRLLKPAAAPTAETPATVDVFVDGVKCKPSPGRTQGDHRWLMADLPRGAVEVLVKARREPGA